MGSLSSAIQAQLSTRTSSFTSDGGYWTGSSFRDSPRTSSSTNYRSEWTDSSYRDSSRSSFSTTTFTSVPAYLYDFSEICIATNNLQDKQITSTTSAAWQCRIKDREVVVFRRKLSRLIQTSEIPERLSFFYKINHRNLIKLLGASIAGDDIYIVYDFENGTNLADCLRNPNYPGFLNWVTRMQIAVDLAKGLEYIHHYARLNRSHVHNHIKSTSIIIAPSLNAKICHFGTAELCGEIDRDLYQNNIREEISSETSNVMVLDSKDMKSKGTIGYMSPEVQSGGVATQKSDVFAFGVVILELLSGEAPVWYRYDDEQRDHKRVSVIETAREVIESRRIRLWIDLRLKDSYPLELVEKMIHLALDCVHADPEKRPDMRQVAGMMSKLDIHSREWASIRTETLSTGTLSPESLSPR